MFYNDEELLTYLSSHKLDAIVVEGYDGVGKGRVLNVLSNYYQVTPYRPDYNLWQRHDHRYQDRWKVSGFFWDVYSHFMEGRSRSGPPMLFDRGVMSGAVYAHDDSIAEDYKKLLRDMRVLHILVTCTEEDFYHFADVRNISHLDYKVCEDFTNEYKRLFELAGVEYVIYENHYDKSLAERLSRTCAGCGHYSYGYCRHPDINDRTNSDYPRCELSYDEEVQDKYAAEMHSVQS